MTQYLTATMALYPHQSLPLDLSPHPMVSEHLFFECFTELYNLGTSKTHTIKKHQKQISSLDTNVLSLHLRSCGIFHLRVRKDFLTDCLPS